MSLVIVGPLPPALGGVASITAALHADFRGHPDVQFIDSAKGSHSGIRAVRRPIQLLLQLIRAAQTRRGSRIFVFSSARGSFWEKLGWATIARLWGCRLTMMMVDGGFPEFYASLSRPQRLLATRMMSQVEALVAQSDSWAQYYKGLFPRANVVTVRAGVDTGFFEPSGRPRTSGAPVILYVGWLIEEKGVLDLLRALKILAERGIKVRARLVGPTFERDAYFAARLTELGLDANVDIVGSLPSSQALQAEYQSADLFTLPSHFEGLPMALLEAVASGLPCVATAVGGMPEILEHGRCGVLVPAKDPMALADAIDQLLGDAPRRNALGLLARERAVSEYRLDQALASYRGILGL